MVDPKTTTLPAALTTLSRSRRFWNDYFWERRDDAEDARYPEVADRPLRFEVAPGWALVLSLDDGLTSMGLSVEGPSGEIGELGWDDQAHWHPHVLRWEELDLIAHAVAVRDPAASHPGIPLLLLYRFAPVCSDEDARLAFPLLETAWRKLGVFRGRRQDQLIEFGDARTAGFIWSSAQGRWTLRQNDDDAERALYTLRNSENDEFPFDLLDGLLRHAEQTIVAAGVGRSSRAVSVRPPRLRERAQVSLPVVTPAFSLPGSAGRFYADRIDAVLRELDLGSAEGFGERTGYDSSGREVEATSSISVALERDCELAERLVGATLLWSRAPGETTLRRAANTRRLSEWIPGEAPIQLGVRRFKIKRVKEVFGSGPIIHYLGEPLGEENATVNALASRSEHAPDDDGIHPITFGDGGRLRVRQTGDDAIDGFGCIFDQLSLEACGFVLELSRADDLILVPMMITASRKLARELDRVWPGTSLVEEPAELLKVLQQGPRQWWERRGPALLAERKTDPEPNDPSSPRKWWRFW